MNLKNSDGIHKFNEFCQYCIDFFWSKNKSKFTNLPKELSLHLLSFTLMHEMRYKIPQNTHFLMRLTVRYEKKHTPKLVLTHSFVKERKVEYELKKKKKTAKMMIIRKQKRHTSISNYVKLFTFVTFGFHIFIVKS